MFFQHPTKHVVPSVQYFWTVKSFKEACSWNFHSSITCAVIFSWQ